MIQSTVIMFLLSMFLIFVTSNAAKIFCVFPIPSHSHQQPMLALSRALASRGHNLTVITSDPSEVPIENHREINMHYLYGLDKQDPEAFEKKIGFTTQKRQTPFALINALPAIIDAISLAMFASPQIQDLKKEVNGTNFDLMIVEPMFVTSMLGFSDLIGNPPIVGIVSYIPLPIVDFEFGNPIIPSYIPHLLTPYTDCMSLFQRIINLYTIFHNFFILNYLIRPSQEKIMREQFGNTERFLKDLEFNKSLLIISADLSSSYPRPVQPNTIYVGPLHLKGPHPLAEDLKKWIDEAEDGIIYFSLGSNTKGTSMLAEKQKAFIKTFNQFPKMRVLWKWEKDSDLPGRTENIIIRKWFPQQSILAHPKMKLFISQVGVQSLQEAVYNAIPILGIPMTADQDSNIMKLETVGAGLYMEFNEINYETVYEKVKELLTNNSYKENMVRLSSIVKDKPMSAVDTAVWWVEYVLRHKGAPHLRPAALDLTWYQYHMLEVLVPLVLIIAIISRFLIYYTYYTIKAIWRFYSPTPLSPVSSLPSTSPDVTAASTESPAKTSARKVRKIKKN